MTLAFVIGVVLVLIVLLIVARRSKRTSAAWRSEPSIIQRDAASAAQAEVEENDIEEMLEAQAALRRRRGAPSIGDELADAARRGGAAT